MQNKIIAIVGCMYTGKSTRLVDEYIELKKQEKTIDAFKPASSKRGGEFIISRDRDVKIPCQLVSDITEALQSNADVIFIDEFQFFQKQQFNHAIKTLKEQNKKVFIAGLDKNGVNEYWDNYSTIQKYSDRIDLLKMKCQLCNIKDADFSCLEQFGKNKSCSTKDGAIYSNLCQGCSNGRNAFLK